MTPLLVVFASSFCLCLFLTPLIRALADRFGLVDRPDGRRKLHHKPIPLAGGIALLLSLFGALAVSLIGPAPVNAPFGEQELFLPGLLSATLVIGAVGLIDDFRRLRCLHKLLGQLLAAGILVASGFAVQTVRFFDWQLELGLLAVPFTLFWLLGTINALNLLDGMDGLLSCVGLIIGLATMAMAAVAGQGEAACAAAALTGALVGFLPYNFPPATIFLGDSGSMLIGLVIGALALRGSAEGPATLPLAAPLAMLTIPAFDTAAAIVRRKLTGHSVFTPDLAHLHHCLLRRGLSTRWVLFWISAACLCTSAGALASVWFEREFFAVVAALAVVGIFGATRLFGFDELLLIKNRLLTGLRLHREISAKNGRAFGEGGV